MTSESTTTSTKCTSITSIAGTNGIDVYDKAIYAHWDEDENLIYWEIKDGYEPDLRPC
tara:strand:- start:583 stop:756 length:174 start_codon:yes stop_codon:yes gene_type:complete